MCVLDTTSQEYNNVIFSENDLNVFRIQRHDVCHKITADGETMHACF